MNEINYNIKNFNFIVEILILNRIEFFQGEKKKAVFKKNMG